MFLRKRSAQVEVFTPLARRLTSAEVASLREWMGRDDTKLAIRLIKSLRPGLSVSYTADAQINMQRESQALHFCRGWNYCMTLFERIADASNPDEKTPEITENWGIEPKE